MSAFRSALAGLLGLFIDDGALAAAALILIGAVAVAVKVAGLSPLAGGVLLLCGCIAILAESVHRAARGKAHR